MTRHESWEEKSQSRMDEGGERGKGVVGITKGRKEVVLISWIPVGAEMRTWRTSAVLASSGGKEILRYRVCMGCYGIV